MEGPFEYNMARLSEDTGSAVFPGDTGAIRVYFDVEDIKAGPARQQELGDTADDPQPGARDGLVRDRLRYRREPDRPLADDPSAPAPEGAPQ
jgi:hypothetical protein